MLSSMLSVSSVLDVSSNNGPSTDDVLFKEDLSLTTRLEPKIASKSTFEMLSSGTTSGPKVHVCDRGLSSAVNVFKLSLCLGCYCQIMQI